MSDTQTSSRFSRRWLFPALGLLVIVLLLWWFWPSPPAEQKGRGPWGRGDGGPVPVRVAPVEQGDFAIQLKALGTVTAYNTVNVRSRVDGELVKVLFEEGQMVKAGDLLAVIDPRPYEVALQQAEGTLQENRAQLQNAEIDLKRYQGLYAEDSIAKQTLDTQLALVNQYRGTLQANQAAVNEAKLNLQFTQIRAPISGRLGLRQVDVGNLISSGDTTPLVVITQTLPIAVSFTLPEGDLPQVLKARASGGEPLVVEAWDRSERQLLATGEMESLDNQIDTTTGTVRMKARFANADEILFPNQFVNVRLRVETRRQASLIPAAALQYGSRGTFVFVVGADDKVSVRSVQAGPSDGERTLIEEGVALGERLVLEGTDRLRDGAQVEVITDPPATPLPAMTSEGDEKKRDA
ncbi:MdtA/MuxA family multidrug efflux RND transporter periplasmic adaptor subunit [Pseudomonas indica]|uniref:MdtA/MuxA family multidrug efflux RND transporter periplasmic adaptor subunit n=1 Tax=Pseudomonas indica TaxID=137658 RepID=UPI0023F8C67A|nr:MdtA/MuxA family multidrug efflux RND transporter periplasmic adaptor subunit [Pseudomonas indica]MBU3056197.1 MdtA/MuxA family multidrug efflux RND transporter periplasmic adaptor subunit [Pseudomonas indica]